jgi:hypothetical protein
MAKKTTPKKTAARKSASKKTAARKSTSKKTAARKPDSKSKQCARCLKRKPLDSFGKNSRMKLGRKSYCRVCSSKLQREWNEEQRTAQESKRKRR